MLKISNRFTTLSYLKSQFMEDPFQTLLDVIFSCLTFLGLLIVLLIIVLSLLILFEGARPVLDRFGISNIISISFQNNNLSIFFPSQWNLNATASGSGVTSFGVAIFVAGTIVTSIIAILLALPLSVGSALFINEYAPKHTKKSLSFMFQLIAAIPSVVFGLWAIYVFGPFTLQYIVPIITLINTQNSWIIILIGTIITLYFILKTFLTAINKKIGIINGLGRLLLMIGSYIFFLYIIQLIITPPYSASVAFNVLLAILVLTIMITPFVAALAQEIFAAVPESQREAAYALGATSWEVTKMSVLPMSKRGIFGALILGYGRAIGETMAVTMTIGNSDYFFASIRNQGATITSVLAAEFGEALSNPLSVGVLLELGLLLFIFSFIINTIAHFIIGRSATATSRMEI